MWRWVWIIFLWKWEKKELSGGLRIKLWRIGIVRSREEVLVKDIEIYRIGRKFRNDLVYFFYVIKEEIVV